MTMEMLDPLEWELIVHIASIRNANKDIIIKI
jgi:hypothetical protein